MVLLILAQLAVIAIGLARLAWLEPEAPGWVVAGLVFSLLSLVMLVAKWLRGRH